jgi:hypothetical protein
VAAAVSIKQDKGTAQVDMDAVQAELQRQGVRLH